MKTKLHPKFGIPKVPLRKLRRFKQQCNLLTKTVDAKGYVRLDGRLLHQMVYRLHWGAPPKGWDIHHINCQKTDNKPENLIAMPASLHQEIHRLIKEEKRILWRKELEDIIQVHTGRVASDLPFPCSKWPGRVLYDRFKQRWYAELPIKGKQQILGYSYTEKGAAELYNMIAPIHGIAQLVIQD